MADDADRAQEAIERAEAHLAAHAFRVRHPSITCRECDDVLELHRREYGTYIECQKALEREANLYARRYGLP